MDIIHNSPYGPSVSPWGTFYFKHNNKTIKIDTGYNAYARYSNSKLWDWLTNVKYNSPLNSYIVFGMQDIKEFEQFNSQS